MLSRLKSLFGKRTEAPSLPHEFWVLLRTATNAADGPLTSPEHLLEQIEDLAKQAQGADELLIFGDADSLRITIFSSQENVQQFVTQLTNAMRKENPNMGMGAFTTAVMQKPTLFRYLTAIPNLQAVLDPGAPTERVVPPAEIRASAGPAQ